MKGAALMCLGVPGRVLSAPQDHLATVEVQGVARQVNVGMLAEETLLPGDWVVIHAGYALETISEDEARATEAAMDLSDLFPAGIETD